MLRKTRSQKEVSVNWNKRIRTSDIVSHFIIFPVVPSIIGNGNDFFIYALGLYLNGKNLKKERCQQLFRGFHLTEAISTMDLEKSEESGWFTSCRSKDLEKIGKISGYFLREFAYTIPMALNEEFLPDKYLAIEDDGFNKFVKSLKDDKIIVPGVIQINIARTSKFDVNRFTSFTSDEVGELISGVQLAITCNVKLHNIKAELHDWAWELLENPNINQHLPRPVISREEEIGCFESVDNLDNSFVQLTSTSPIDASTYLQPPSTTNSMVTQFPSSAQPVITKMKTRNEGRRLQVAPFSRKCRRTGLKYYNTRSQRPATLPPNTTFAWVSLKGNGKRSEMAQVITTAGDLGMTLYEFSTCKAETKPEQYKVALRKFNYLYSTNFD